MMTDFKTIQNFRHFESQLNALGYKVSATDNAFFIHNKKGTIVADVQSVDGLRGFLQGVEWVEATIAGALV